MSQKSDYVTQIRLSHRNLIKSQKSYSATGIRLWHRHPMAVQASDPQSRQPMTLSVQASDPPNPGSRWSLFPPPKPLSAAGASHRGLFCRRSFCPPPEPLPEPSEAPKAFLGPTAPGPWPYGPRRGVGPCRLVGSPFPSSACGIPIHPLQVSFSDLPKPTAGYIPHLRLYDSTASGIVQA